MHPHSGKLSFDAVKLILWDIGFLQAYDIVVELANFLQVRDDLADVMRVDSKGLVATVANRQAAIAPANVHKFLENIARAVPEATGPRSKLGFNGIKGARRLIPPAKFAKFAGNSSFFIRLPLAVAAC